MEGCPLQHRKIEMSSENYILGVDDGVEMLNSDAGLHNPWKWPRIPLGVRVPQFEKPCPKNSLTSQ